MGNLIKTDLEEMKVTSEKQNTYFERFKTELTNVKTSIENVEEYWNAEDGRVYGEKFRNLHTYLEDQSKILESIAKYFTTAEESYEQTDLAHRDSFSNFCSSLQGSI
jgi:uncharacterized protein YukE